MSVASSSTLKSWNNNSAFNFQIFPLSVPTIGNFFSNSFCTKVLKSSQCANLDKKFISCHISVQFQFEMVVLKVLREFAVGTSIHGFTFLVSPKSSSRTKIIWAIAIIVALSYASWEMKNSVISKYYYNLEPWNRNQCLLSNDKYIKSKFYKKRGATFFYDVTRKLGPLDFTQYRSKSSSF